MPLPTNIYIVKWDPLSLCITYHIDLIGVYTVLEVRTSENPVHCPPTFKAILSSAWQWRSANITVYWLSDLFLFYDWNYWEQAAEPFLHLKKIIMLTFEQAAGIFLQSVFSCSVFDAIKWAWNLNTLSCSFCSFFSLPSSCSITSGRYVN